MFGNVGRMAVLGASVACVLGMVTIPQYVDFMAQRIQGAVLWPLAAITIGGLVYLYGRMK